MINELFFDALASRLRESGWRLDADVLEPDYRTYIRDEGEVIFQFGVSFNRNRANPSLGVQHPRTSELVAKFHRRPDPPERTASVCSVGASLTDLVRRASPELDVLFRWHVADVQDMGRVVGLICEDLESVGIPFLESVASLTRIVDHLSANDKRYQALNGHLAIAAALLGRTAVASDALADYMNQARPQTGPIAEQSRTFVAEYVLHFGMGHTVTEPPDAAIRA